MSHQGHNSPLFPCIQQIVEFIIKFVLIHLQKTFKREKRERCKNQKMIAASPLPPSHYWLFYFQFTQAISTETP